MSRWLRLSGIGAGMWLSAVGHASDVREPRTSPTRAAMGQEVRGDARGLTFEIPVASTIFELRLPATFEVDFQAGGLVVRAARDGSLHARPEVRLRLRPKPPPGPTYRTRRGTVREAHYRVEPPDGGPGVTDYLLTAWATFPRTVVVVSEVAPGPSPAKAEFSLAWRVLDSLAVGHRPDTRRLAPAQREQAAKELFDGSVSPEEYAAREAHKWGSFSFDGFRYRDATLDAWVLRLGDILFKRNGAPDLVQLRRRFLTATERQQVEQELKEGGGL